MTEWRRLLGVSAAVITVAVLLSLPAPDRVGPAPGGGFGPPTLAGVWPDAVVTTFDGSSYRPALILDADTSLGYEAAAFVLRSSTGTVVLSDTPVPAMTATADRVYWMRDLGGSRYTIMVADRGGRDVRELTADVGTPQFTGSQHDVQVAAGRLWWVSTGGKQLRSVGLSGGAVTVRELDGEYALSAWPWVTSVAPGAGVPVRLVNLDTGEARGFTPPVGALVSCGPTWCRTLTGESTVALDLYRTDGQDVRRLIDGNTRQRVADVALLERFEVVTLGAGDSSVEVSLYDIVKGSLVLVEPAASDVHARDGFLWWSTGATWHALDLKSLR